MSSPLCHDASQKARITLDAFRHRFRCNSSLKSDSHLFSSLDSDADGFITYTDLIRVVREKDLPLDEQDCRSLMAKLDKDKTGSVNLGEFLRSISEKQPSFLDQLSRTIVGVKRGGGTVYRQVDPQNGCTTRSQSTTTSSILSITGAIQGQMRTFRPRSGRLDNLYDGLVVPHRNLPWEDYTRHTVQPCPWIPGNPQIMTDRARHITTSMAFGTDFVCDPSLPIREDKVARDRRELFNRTMYRSNSVEASRLASQRDKVADELDQRRLAYKSASIMDYHDRVGGKYCHVAD